MQMMKKTALTLLAGAAIGGLSLAAAPAAHATKTVTSPYVSAGEWELAWKGSYEIDNDSDVDGAWKQTIELGYGVNPFWGLEVEGEVEKDGDNNADAEFAAVEVKSKFQLTPRGAYWLDAGIRLGYTYSTNAGADTAEAKFLLAKKTGDFAHAFNASLEKDFEDGESEDAESGLAWATSYSYSESFEPGFEIYSDFGALSDTGSFSDQDHRIDPVAYGEIGPAEYDAGILFGVSDGAPDATLKLILETEF